ncbi:uncharacterized protein [Euwallacea fornicatus]|uniref:uncharacterized protein n=1 Tax=Euwallacea fornicatus TaxID=995702 RepID=UPI00338FA3E5
MADVNEDCIVSDRHFGFVMGKCTVDAMRTVMRIVDGIREISYTNAAFCVMVTVDVKNALNSVPWDLIVEMLRRSQVSRYLVEVVQSYLDERTVQLPNGEVYGLTYGVPQGGVTPEVYADDLALVVTAGCRKTFEMRTMEAVELVTDTFRVNGLGMALVKTEMALQAERRKITGISVVVDGFRYATGASLKYLGAWFDEKHPLRVNGLSFDRRRVMIMVASSALLYAAPIWHRVLGAKTFRAVLKRANRMFAIRGACAYRTVPCEAVLALDKIPSIRLCVKERRMVWERDKDFRNEAREWVINEWESEWAVYDGELVESKRKWKVFERMVDSIMYRKTERQHIGRRDQG